MKIYIWTVLLLGATACATAYQAGAATNSDYHVPAQTNDGWPVGTLSEAAIDSTLIIQMLGQIHSNKYQGINSVLLARNGTLVVEEYFGSFDRDSLHNMKSAAKSITSALVGIAIDQGFIQSVDAKLLPYFPEYDGSIDNWDGRKEDITLKHLLSMTSGIKGNEDAMYPTNDWIKFYLDQPLVAAPGDTFSYATGGVVTLGNVITRASDLRIPDFANRYLFGPLGITVYHWPITNSRGSQGLAMTGGGLSLRPRDMAKFGQLYLNGGTWKGHRVVSENWIAESTSKQTTSDLYGEDFGYLWRMLDREVGGESIRSYEAWGNGGMVDSTSWCFPHSI
ncbi:serine hydrolase domain-containing protein [Neolewinella sp.]|uniref:serine hydrolase domain-containing protein n=1 Tax=Neolewinella sp. TaxID=2993543 RepID=UPI003B52AF1A